MGKGKCKRERNRLKRKRGSYNIDDIDEFMSKKPTILFSDDIDDKRTFHRNAEGDLEEIQEKKKAKASQPFLVEGPHLHINPMASPARITRSWADDALTAVWDHSRELGQLQTIYGAYKLQLRRPVETPDEKRVLSNQDLEWCYRIVEATSSAAYKSSSMGWHSQSKQREMADKDMLYLVVRTIDGACDAFAPNVQTDIIAFASFKMELDDPPNQHRHVAYIYEVHVAEKFRGKGLGRWLVFTVEAMAQDVGIYKTMLTVFTSNKAAIGAYEKMGYSRDSSTPPGKVVRGRSIECDYMIMGKSWHGSTGEIKKVARG